MSSPDNVGSHGRSDFFNAMRRGVLLGLAVLLLALPPIRWNIESTERPAQHSTAAPTPGASANPGESSVTAPPPSRRLPANPPRFAKFGTERASPEARHVANWVLHSGDNEQRAVVIVDKRDAKVFVFSPQGRLLAAAPALLGSAVGDHTVPGVGDKPLSQVRPDERTTPAGRFIAEPGVNTKGEDIIWVDYDAAVSMHRVRPNVKAERRLQRLASATPEDNRISFGCINLPVTFYEKVLSPTVHKMGAVVYVLPETQSPQALFGSYDISASTVVAQR